MTLPYLLTLNRCCLSRAHAYHKLVMKESRIGTVYSIFFKDLRKQNNNDRQHPYALVFVILWHMEVLDSVDNSTEHHIHLPWHTDSSFGRQWSIWDSIQKSEGVMTMQEGGQQGKGLCQCLIWIMSIETCVSLRRALLSQDVLYFTSPS